MATVVHVAQKDICDTNPASLMERCAGAADLLKKRIKEWLEFDSTAVKRFSSLTGLAVGGLLYAARCPRRGFSILAKVHRSAAGGLSSRLAERLARSAAGARAGSGAPHPLITVYDRHVENTPRDTATEKFFQDPLRLLKSLAIVVKSPRDNEKGVIIINYSYLFPLFAKLFDVPAVARRYHLVLEPSWSGYCNLDILCYSRYDFPVFVQAYEPYDAEFIERSRSNLVTVRTSTNWWVDHRVFRPRDEIAKDVDVIMVASWADFKRHHRLFAALRKLRGEGLTPKVALLGYPCGRSRADICRQARYYGVLDCLEMQEQVPPEEVGRQMNRAKVNVIWSRKEGVNRAIIEGMFAGVPCIIREGFNYGYRYPYINPQTGCFAAENELPARLRWMIENHHRYRPRNWVMANMTCQHATAILSDVIRDVATRRGERWTQELAVKVNRLNDMGYWDEADEGRFEPDYEYLRSVIRR